MVVGPDLILADVKGPLGDVLLGGLISVPLVLFRHFKHQQVVVLHAPLKQECALTAVHILLHLDAPVHEAVASALEPLDDLLAHVLFAALEPVEAGINVKVHLAALAGPLDEVFQGQESSGAEALVDLSLQRASDPPDQPVPPIDEGLPAFLYDSPGQVLVQGQPLDHALLMGVHREELQLCLLVQDGPVTVRRVCQVVVAPLDC
mmetsp:Transcript_20933/g.39159  ORF Transcript_20933/g.39159 Transcript_20933/m.39159 type:complete len:205 (-) Transcript_20933:50-664(-)